MNFVRAIRRPTATAAFFLALLNTAGAFAACSSPTGNPGDIIYSSTSNIMAYCNGTIWIAMSGAGGTGSVATGGTGSTSQTTNGVNYYNGSAITSNSNFTYNGSSVGIGTSTATAGLTIGTTMAVPFGTNYTTTGAQSDVAINGNGSIRYTGSGAATFNGIVAGYNGQILYLHNGSASSTLTLANQSTSEVTYANQIVTGTGSALTVAANSAVILQYDSTATNSSGATGAWRVIGGSGSSGGGGSNTVWQMIASTDITSAVTSYTFSGLTGDTDGEYQIVGRFVAGSSTATSYYLQPNADTTTTDYGYQYIQGNGSTASAGSLTSYSGLFLGDTGAATGQLSFSTSTLYAKSGYVRTMKSQLSGYVSGTSITYDLSMSQAWNNTSSQITSLVVAANQTNGLGVGTHLELWAPRTVGGGSLSGGTANYVPVWNSASTLGTSAIYQSSGNIGLGTTSPANALDVYSGGIHIGSSTPSSTTNALYSIGTSLMWNGSAVGSGSSGTNNSMVTGWPDAVLCNSGSNHWIEVLMVVGSTQTSYMDAGGDRINFTSSGAYSSQSGLTGYDCVSGSSISQLTSSGNTFNFAKGPAAQWLQNGTAAYYNAGNVGIGTTSPSTALDVNGTIRSESGGIKFPDASVQSTAAPSNVDCVWDNNGSSNTLFCLNYTTGRIVSSTGGTAWSQWCTGNQTAWTSFATGGPYSIALNYISGSNYILVTRLSDGAVLYNQSSTGTWATWNSSGGTWPP